MRIILTPPRVAAALAIALVAASCSGTAAPPDGRPLVVATTAILGDVVSRVGGDAVRVEVLIPTGADPHEYAPSASDVALLHDADLVVANGLNLETGLADALATVTGDVPVLAIGPAVDPLEFPGGIPDPHVWFDPERMATAVGLIRDALETAAPESAAAIDAASDAFLADLRAVDAEVAGLVAGVPVERRLIVANHAFLGYFADRYGFEIVGSVIPGGSTVEEPSAADLAALADAVTARGVPVVFSESNEPTTLADALAAEAGGLPVVPLFSAALPGGGSYLDLLRTDAMRIVDALK
jgi:zinc/manganese transport system substrate-binding protein